MLRNSPALFKGGGTGAGYLKPETLKLEADLVETLTYN